MNGQRHIVHRQVLALTLGTEDEAHAALDDVRRLYYARLQPVLDEVFSRAVPPDVVLRLDRLEVDLGRVGRETLEADLANRLRRQIEEALSPHLGGATDAHPTPERISLPHARRAALVAFFVTGRLPWWVPAPDAFDPSAAMRDLLDTDAGPLLAEVRRCASPAVLRRLAQQFEPDVLEVLVQRLAPAHGPAVAAARASWARVLQRAAAPLAAAPPELLWHAAIEAALAPTPHAPGAAFNLAVAARLARAVFETPSSVVRHAAADAAEALPREDPVRRWLDAQTDAARARRAAAAPPEAATTETEDDAPFPPPAPPRPDAPPQGARRAARAPEPESTTRGTHPAPRTPPPGAPLPEAAAPDPRHADLDEPAPAEAATTETEDDAVPAEATYVANAGVVLLWPFLGRFFDEVGLLHDGTFASGRARERAVLVVRYLATGEAAAPEHRLLLDKVLCGHPPAEPVPRRIEPTDAEARAAAALLASVVTRWEALGKTSVEGFRTAFLQREGRLSRREAGWQLYVERRGYDVLLDRLPWGLGVVKHRWMPQPLFVEW